MSLESDLPKVALAQYEHLDLYRRDAAAWQLYLYLDPQRERAWIDWDERPGGAVSPALWFGVQLRYAIGGVDEGIPTGAAATNLLLELEPLLAQVCSGHTVSGWGQDQVGRLDAAAEAASEELEWGLGQHCWGDWDGPEVIHEISVEEWLAATDDLEVAGLTDAVLAVMADAICEAASAAGYLITDDVADHLRRTRDAD